MIFVFWNIELKLLRPGLRTFISKSWNIISLVGEAKKIIPTMASIRFNKNYCHNLLKHQDLNISFKIQHPESSAIFVWGWITSSCSDDRFWYMYAIDMILQITITKSVFYRYVILCFETLNWSFWGLERGLLSPRVEKHKSCWWSRRKLRPTMARINFHFTLELFNSVSLKWNWGHGTWQKCSIFLFTNNKDQF